MAEEHQNPQPNQFEQMQKQMLEWQKQMQEMMQRNEEAVQRSEELARASQELASTSEELAKSSREHKRKSKQSSAAFEEGLNKLRKGTKNSIKITSKKSVLEEEEQNEEEDSDDAISVASIVSTGSLRSTASIRARKGFMKKGQRMYILSAFTIPQLREMHTYRGRTPNGSNKKELVYSAVNLVKTRDELVDFMKKLIQSKLQL